MQIGNLDIFLESITIVSACNKVLRKRFLQHDTIGLIPTGGYKCNKNYSKKAMMWLLHMEETDGVNIMHGRECTNYPSLVLTVTVPRLEKYTSSLDVIFTVTRVNRTVTSSPRVAIH